MAIMHADRPLRPGTETPQPSSAEGRFVGGDARAHLTDLLAAQGDLVERVAKQENVRLAVAASLRALRRSAGLRQKDLAARLGVTQGWVSKLESGLHDHPLEQIVAFVHAVGADLALDILQPRDDIARYRVTTASHEPDGAPRSEQTTKRAPRKPGSPAGLPQARSSMAAAPYPAAAARVQPPPST